MLARISEALGRRAGPATAPEPLPPFPARAVALDAGERSAQFMSELEKVGGRATRLDTEGEVKESLTGLLPADLDAPVALSDGRELRRLKLRAWLSGAGRKVVPSLKEFLAESSSAGSRGAAEAEVAALVERYRGLLLEAEVGITTADYALADTGTLVLVSGDEQHRLISLLPPAHVCLLDPARILPSLADLLARLRGIFSPPESALRNMTCITGPSRTADIEQAITTGVHGPKSLHVILHSPAS